MRLKWFGTATILLEQDGMRLLFDPFLTINPGLFQPPVDELSEAGHIFITHAHFDHLVDVPFIMKRSGGKTAVYGTAKPCEILASKGVNGAHINQVAPGDALSIGPFEINVLKGRHIVFDRRILIKTILNPRIMVNWSNFRYMLRESRTSDEAGETVVYHIRTAGRSVLLMGSLNLDDGTAYPTGADLLILPYQGRSDVADYAMPFIERLQPKTILLDHFDDTFPPISSPVDTEPFLSLMRQNHPGIPVICPRASAEWIEIF